MKNSEDTVVLGLDIGSTTVKTTVLDQKNNCIFNCYQRHFSDIRATVTNLLTKAKETLGDIKLAVAITGSGGLSLSERIGLPFIQEVIACTKAVEEYIPQTDVVIELGGEDAKITYFSGMMEQRMNGACAGGTGAFIDQMALLLRTDALGLDDLAKNHNVIYPIASRCGVFAKTDIQPLINQGAAKEDIAASIFQAVVNQTITGLACGKPIRGKVAFLGGPLHFLPQLRQAFINTLNLTDETAILPDNAHYYVALGCALSAKEDGLLKKETLSNIIHRLESIKVSEIAEKNGLEPLFFEEEDLVKFRQRHSQAKAQRKPLEEASGDVYLGIDAGSTTSKAVLIDNNRNILYTFYAGNQGEPVDLCVSILKDIYAKLPQGVTIANTVVTGYGEDLVKSALKADIGEVETMSHYKAAEQFLPGVEFILDIGGQDMKAIRINDGIIESIILNEACSSGCGSFIETFAQSLDMSVNSFADSAIKSKKPVDLGNRCTVFMNSKVKQAQKEGATVEDISAGLSYSVIKNALYKVIKIRRPEEFGEKILAQGGTFYNEAVLRAFEKETKREVVRPDIAGLMGAMGAAIIAQERHVSGEKSTIIKGTELENFSYEKSFRYCEKCPNKCLLTVVKFTDGRNFISGNRCQRGAGIQHNHSDLPNLYDYKYKRLFAYKSLPADNAPRGVIGIPRVLNMYENYPFWHTLFTNLGFSVVLSRKSSKAVFEMGMESIPSEAVCYPAKLAHGHIKDLINNGIKTIFYPSVVYETKEYSESDNNFNCPVVSGYPDVIKNNIEEFRTADICYLRPFVTLNDSEKLVDSIFDTFYKHSSHDIGKEEIKQAVIKAFHELSAFRQDVHTKGEEVLTYIKENNIHGVVLSGRPYHVDPEINHGLPNIITDQGMAVLTEDSVAHLGTIERPLRVRDQWSYHSRLYAAASFVATRDDLELIQLTSFGCGLDAVTSDQVEEILGRKNKIYTTIKIDEGDNLGAAKIRIRSLKVTIEEKKSHTKTPSTAAIIPLKKPLFTKEMKTKHTILVPQMSPIHFQFLYGAMKANGYNVEVLPEVDKEATEEGLKYVHNDACYPCIITTGQLINALKSGKYDLNNISLMMSQTGGQCRATNYVSFIRKALKDAGMDHIPVIAISAQKLERHPGVKWNFKLLKHLILAINYGDALMNVLYRVRPYEAQKGSVNALYEKWVEKGKQTVYSGSLRRFKKDMKQLVKEFDEITLTSEKKPKVGLVGEILVKFSPDANNHIVELIEKEGGEASMPPLLDFMLYSAYNSKYKAKYLQGGIKAAKKADSIIALLEWSRKPLRKALEKSNRFQAPGNINEMAGYAKEIVSLGNQAGEGWFLTSEMLELMENGINNIVCMQPFACLPNHITGRGALKEIKYQHPKSNIIAIDYDPGASESNQINRIKLMMSVAKKNLKKDNDI